MSKQWNSTQSRAHPSPEDYQDGFYKSSSKVRDRESRLRKAEKIIYALTKLASPPLAASICLDLGCSSGTITNALAPLFERTIGMDYDEEALNHVDQSSSTRSTFLRGDAMDLPFASSSTDVIICAQVYEHVPDDRELVAEIYRVLKPNGLVFFSGPNRLHPIEPHYSLPFLHWLPDRLANSYLRIAGRGDHYYEHSRTMWSLRRLVSRFLVQDITVEILLRRVDLGAPRVVGRLIEMVPSVVWKMLLPFLPNYNWILRKPDDPEAIAGISKQGYSQSDTGNRSGY